MANDKHKHIYKPFDAELRALKDQIKGMGALVGSHMNDALAALQAGDVDAAKRVIDADRAVNQMELAIDEQCIRMLALRQPAASDLRFIAATLKIVTDLERIGDLAVNMAERVEVLAAEPPLRAVADLPRMAAAAQKMLTDALDAFVSQDVAKAEAVGKADTQIDTWMIELFDEVRTEMQKDPKAVNRGIATIFLAKHIERMADHVTNVAEMVVYQVRGQDVRHQRTR
ncbi:MAG TPA: phosphate signaling complex protein PhoU [Kofleriaceae bacterium]|nr:phosphate signaling complex protein PhoU [Kofleriaceae bacterium]